jgi:hypothetical protein
VRPFLSSKAFAALIAAALLTGLLVVRPNVVERWGIYASTTGGASDTYALFLEPFPTRASCEVEARIIVRSGGHAQCRSRFKLVAGTNEQDLLMSQFWPSARWIAFCEAQYRGRAKQPSRLASDAVTGR